VQYLLGELALVRGMQVEKLAPGMGHVLALIEN